jgi:hypothetical protein
MAHPTPRATHQARRGRPPKFGRRGEVVAVTLPEEVVRGLRRVNADLGWAIVTLFENQEVQRTATGPVPDVELATVGLRRRLIVVRRSAFGALPGVSIIPLSSDRAFLALEPGHGMADLELAVADRLEDETVGEAERRALLELRQLLRLWRRDPALRFETRAIIVGEVLRGRRKGGDGA